MAYKAGEVRRGGREADESRTGGKRDIKYAIPVEQNSAGRQAFVCFVCLVCLARVPLIGAAHPILPPSLAPGAVHPFCHSLVLLVLRLAAVWLVVAVLFPAT